MYCTGAVVYDVICLKLNGTWRILTNSPTSFTLYHAVLLAEKFKSVGYSTHIVGKWHLGLCDVRYTPTYRGFDSFTGYLLGAEDYYYHNRTSGGYHGLDLRNSTQCFNSSNVLPKATHDAAGIYSTNVWMNAVERIVRERSVQVDPKPFFLYVPFQSVHGPLQAPVSEMNKYPTAMNGARRKYAGMVSALDDAVSHIEQIYKKYEVWNNTLLIFTTDNGGPLGSANNFPYALSFFLVTHYCIGCG